MLEVNEDPVYQQFHNYVTPSGLHTVDWSQCGLAKLRTPPVRKVHEARRLPKQHLKPLSAGERTP